MKDMLVDGDGRSLLGPSGLGHGARDPSGAFINGVAAVSETGRVLGCARTLRELSSMPDVRARGTPDTGITATCTPGLARAWAERGGEAVALSVDAPFMCLAGEELKGFGDIGAARFDDADSQCVQLRPPRNLRFGESRSAREGMLEATLDWARMRWPTRQPEGFVAAGCVELHFPQTGDFDGPGRSAQQLYADWMDEMDMIWPRSSHACAVVDAPAWSARSRVRAAACRRARQGCRHDGHGGAPRPPRRSRAARARGMRQGARQACVGAVDASQSVILGDYIRTY